MSVSETDSLIISTSNLLKVFTIFGTIILVYFLWLVVKPWLARYMKRKFQQKVNDMFRKAYGMDPSQEMPFGTSNGHARNDTPYAAPRRPRRKIFSRDEGEYVEFEEIHIQADYTSTADHGTSRTHYTPKEPQISDAEWEEIR